MTDLTQVTSVTAEDLKKWYKLQEELAQVKAAEAMLRSRIAKHFFPKPVEGSAENKYPLNDGTGAILQMDHTINRKVLEPELDAYRESLKVEGSNVLKLPLNKLIKWKPELSKSEYNKLTAEERKVCDSFLNIKDGAPQLKIVIPKRPS
jgi:hypothetical protein